MELNEEQKDTIRHEFKDNPSLISLTRRVFNNDDLDGRSREGRAVKDYLSQLNLEYETTAWNKQEDINLSEEEVEFIKAQAENGLSAFQISEILFADVNIKRLSKHHLAVLEFLREYEPAFVHESETGVNKEYVPPKIMSTTISKINEYCQEDVKEDHLNREDVVCIESLRKRLHSPRFVQIISTYSSLKDRSLFEAEFIRATWDKPDLTNDEINLYINVCVDYIHLKNISSHIEKLNVMFNEVQDQQDMTVRLAEVLKSKTDEYDKCEKRMESLIKKLNGDRSERLKNRQQENASILSLVRTFQIEEERLQMVKLADMQKRLVEEEADRIEGMDGWKAKILGISKEDII